MKIQEAITLAIENIQKEGLTDVEVFAVPFELEMVKGAICDRIKQAIKESLKHNNQSFEKQVVKIVQFW